MTPLIQKVVKWADITFSSASSTGKDHDKSFMTNMAKLISEVRKLRASDVTTSSDDFGFDEDRSVFRRLLRPGSSRSTRNRGAPVAYAQIYENDSFTVGMFVLRRTGTRMPLHDHPDMHGIIKVIHGVITVDSYTAIGLGSRVIPVKRLPQLVLDAESEPCCLSPDAGNFHEIKAIHGPATFVDILSPPYDHDSSPGRLCRFYRCEKLSSGESESADSILTECDQPSDFWSDNIPYTGPEVHI